MVVDTSIILALFLNEEHSGWCATELNKHTDTLRMSTVNLADVMIILKHRQPQLADQLIDRMKASGIRFVAPNEKHAEVAAAARLRFPLNLGDCFAYALAKVEDCPIITLDGDFRKSDLLLLSP